MHSAYITFLNQSDCFVPFMQGNGHRKIVRKIADPSCISIGLRLRTSCTCFNSPSRHSRHWTRIGNGELITGSPDTHSSLMFSFTLFSLLSGQFLRGLAEIGEEPLLVDCSVRSVDVTLSSTPQLNNVRSICELVSLWASTSLSSYQKYP